MGISNTSQALLDKSTVNSDTLLTVQSSLSKFSHLLRSPLGVIKGAVDDLKDGLELTKEDIEYASESMTQIVDILNSIRYFTRKIGGFTPQTISLSTACNEFNDLISSRQLRLIINKNSKDMLSFDEVLFRRVLDSLFRYATSRLSRSTGKSNNDLILSATSVKGGFANYQITLELKGIEQNLKSKSLTFAQFAQIDQSIESLGLLLVDEIAQRTKGFTEFATGNDAIILRVQL